MEISIKNSGHSYTSASSKGDTLHLNMNRYQTYATSGGVIDCSTMDIDVGDDPSLAEQPCRLALAKGKDAVIRVGGGENWGEVFSAVRKANDEQPGGYKYHAVGGAAATVSPMVRYLGSVQFIKCVFISSWDLHFHCGSHNLFCLSFDAGLDFQRRFGGHRCRSYLRFRSGPR